MIGFLARLLAKRHFHELHNPQSPLPALALDSWRMYVHRQTYAISDIYAIRKDGDPIAQIIGSPGSGLSALRWNAQREGQPKVITYVGALPGELLWECIVAHETGQVDTQTVPVLVRSATSAHDYDPSQLAQLVQLQRQLGCSLLATWNSCEQMASSAQSISLPLLREFTGSVSSPVPYDQSAPELQQNVEESPSGPSDEVKRQQALDAALAELDQLVGLADVKAQVRQLVNLLRVQKRRSELNMESSTPSLHAALLGNPGTGKTTVARILGKIYYGLGLLEKDVFVEVTRGDLVGQYVGQSAPKTRAQIQKAMGGVLFIDEAYSLNGGGGVDYGGEVIAEIVAAMENYRGEIAIIVAGYTKPLVMMIETNPGLKSRIAHRLHHADYDSSELGEIFNGMLGSSYLLAPDAPDALRAATQAMLDMKDEHFGNGREMRTLFERALMRQADRLASGDVDQLGEQELSELAGADIVADQALKSKNPLGFAA